MADKGITYGSTERYVQPLHDLSILADSHHGPYSKSNDAFQTDEDVHWESKKNLTSQNIIHFTRSQSPSERDDEKEYLHSTPNQHLTSNWDTLIHLIKGNIGTGILAMPQSFKNAGLLVGTFGTIFLGMLCIYTMHMLIYCANELSRRNRNPHLSFGEVAAASFQAGPPRLHKYSSMARIATNTFLYFTQVGICCVYLVFVADNMHEVLSSYYGSAFTIKVCMAILLVPLCALSWVRDLKNLAPIMMFADVLTAMCLGVILIFILQDLPPITERQIFFTSWHQFPIFFSTTIFAFEGIAMILPLQNSMKNPKDFGGWNGVLNKSMLIVLVAYVTIGFFGYLKYGDNVKGSITLNLSTTHTNMWAESVRVMMSLAIFFSYALQFYVPIELTRSSIKHYLPNGRAHVVAELAYRALLVLATFLLAEMVPDLGLFISLVGALTSTTLSFIFPPVFNLLTNWSTGYGHYKWILWKDMLIICFGIFTCLTGTYMSSEAINKG